MLGFLKKIVHLKARRKGTSQSLNEFTLAAYVTSITSGVPPYCNQSFTTSTRPLIESEYKRLESVYKKEIARLRLLAKCVNNF